jgi:cell division protein FtsQ
MRRYNWKKIVTRTLWVLAGIGAMVLLGAAMQKKNQKKCTDIKIEITGVNRQLFIDEKDVLEILNAAGPVTGNRIASLNLRQMEAVVERNPWVRNAEMFLDNNQVLQVRLEERQPIARVFTLDGNSFYLDSGAMRLPLSEKITARVPAFTGFPSERDKLSKPDSLLLKDIVGIGKYILADSFWMAQVAQIAITPQAGFELVPVIGDHIVVMGNADNFDKKFKRLYAFYRQAWLQNGINTYEKLDVQYNNQVVAVKKGTGKTLIDSAKAHQLLQDLLIQNQAGITDSINGVSALLVKPHAAKNVTDSSAVPAAVLPFLKAAHKTNSAPVLNNKANKKPLTNGKKPARKKPVVKANKPKAVMN